MSSKSDTIDEILEQLDKEYDYNNYHAGLRTAKAKLQALLLRERENELTKFHDVIWPFEPHEPCPYCMGESYSVEHSYYDDRLAELSRLSREDSHE